MLTALVLLALAAPADPPKDKELSAEAKGELKKLEGKWMMVQLVEAGKESESKESDAFWVFKGTEVTFAAGDKQEVIHITALDAATDPKCIDITERPKGRPERTLEGVYQIDGETLRIALSVPKGGKNRPTSVEKPTDPRTFVWVFKRVKE